MKKQIALIGGDLRIALLAEIFSKDEWDVQCFGMEEYTFQNQNIQKVESLDKVLENIEIVFSSVPFSKDEKTINTSFSKKEILIKEVFEKMKKGTFFAGVLNEKWEKEYKNITFVDLMKDEVLTIQNAISTAEGAIQKIMEKTNHTIYNSKILILGFGRIGKILANRLQNFGADIFCMARKEDLTWIKVYGYNDIPIEDLKTASLGSFQIIINTIPYLIFGKEEIEKLNPECFVIDLASKPGGFDREEIENKQISFEWALGIPGKVAPLTSAKFLKEAFERYNKKI